jgi:NAD(P)-dependent dehydrogenase (short-subunit alcohol dehydrogenase family)
MLAGLEGEIHPIAMDLSDLASVAAFADAVASTESRLDLLINNAGIMACPETRIGTGWEAQFAINHLGHFVLATQLLPTLLAAEKPRVVSLTSSAHQYSDILWDDIHFHKSPYDKRVAYGQSKTANALFARALDIHYAGEGLKALSVHPGAILTPLQRHLSSDEMQSTGWTDTDGRLTPQAAKFFKTPSQGCTTSLWAATSPLLEHVGGVYCEDCDVAEPKENAVGPIHGVAAWAASDENALRLWSETERMLDS